MRGQKPQGLVLSSARAPAGGVSFEKGVQDHAADRHAPVPPDLPLDVPQLHRDLRKLRIRQLVVVWFCDPHCHLDYHLPTCKPPRARPAEMPRPLVELPLTL